MSTLPYVFAIVGVVLLYLLFKCAYYRDPQGIYPILGYTFLVGMVAAVYHISAANMLFTFLGLAPTIGAIFGADALRKWHRDHGVTTPQPPDHERITEPYDS